jgi:hypothetical protein
MGFSGPLAQPSMAPHFGNNHDQKKTKSKEEQK